MEMFALALTIAFSWTAIKLVNIGRDLVEPDACLGKWYMTSIVAWATAVTGWLVAFIFTCFFIFG